MRENEGTAAASQRLRTGLIPLIEVLQRAAPVNLLPRSYLASAAAESLTVSGQAVRGYMTSCVRNGSLVEIRPRRDWLVELLSAYYLPGLYAEKVEESYRLVREKPQSRGAGQISFLITPDSLSTLVGRLREQYRVPVRDTMAEFPEDVPHAVTSARYDQLVQMVGDTCGLNDRTARRAVDGMMGQLNLHLL